MKTNRPGLLNSLPEQYIIEFMKRNGLALLVHPYKNVLMKKERMQEFLNSFAGKLLAIATAHPNLRINVTLPGYMLQHLDPLLLSRLNELQKANCLEWLTPGYTEPFINFAPQWLSRDNLQLGQETFQELVGVKPSGYVPAFSNWEPCFIKTLNEIGMHYAVLSRALFPQDTRKYTGHWITEHSGTTLVVIPSYSLHFTSAPDKILTWLDQQMDDTTRENGTPCIALDYRVPLGPDHDAAPFAWLDAFASSLDAVLIKYQLHLLHEFPETTTPLGLHYLPSCLEFNLRDDASTPSCSNYLHTFDVIGIMQRKMMDIADKIGSLDNSKEALPLKNKLFFAQDINRYLPNIASGFPHINDRTWTFKQMIDIENELVKKEKGTGGQARIADLLRNGAKSIAMSNNTIKAYIDHKNGGQVYELDYHERSVNLFAGYNPAPHSLPRILVPGESRISFIDHFVTATCASHQSMAATETLPNDFMAGSYDYQIKKSSSGIKTVLNRQGHIIIQDKQYPLQMEKVFALEKDKPNLLFVYKLSNHSLATFSFKLAVELTFSLPGAETGQAAITCNRSIYDTLSRETITLEQVTKWTLIDRTIGTAVHFLTQKPVTVWSYPALSSSPYQGTSIVIITPVTLEESSAWSLMGKISCKKIKMRGDFDNVI